jgi:hypothetical protein
MALSVVVFPRPVGAEQGRDAALADGERHALEDEDNPVVDDLDIVMHRRPGGPGAVWAPGPAAVTPYLAALTCLAITSG